jgi:hypothetical protein
LSKGKRISAVKSIIKSSVGDERQKKNLTSLYNFLRSAKNFKQNKKIGRKTSKQKK